MDDDSKNILERGNTNRLFELLREAFIYQLDIKKVPVEWAGGEVTGEFSIYFDCSYFIATTDINPCPLIHDFMKSYYNDIYFTVTLTNADTPCNYVMKKKKHNVPSINSGNIKCHSLTEEEFERMKANFKDYLNSIDPCSIVIKRIPDYEVSKTTVRSVTYDH